MIGQYNMLIKNSLKSNFVYLYFYGYCVIQDYIYGVIAFSSSFG